MNMNSFEGKRILALIREGDYAHAGEEEAIERRSARFQETRIGGCLTSDAGAAAAPITCGAMDGVRLRESIAMATSIEYARATYPEVGFHVCDVLDVPRTVTRTFDVIYMLNAFYAFDRQREALAELRKVAKPGAQLVIFDYTVGAKAGDTPNPMMPHAIRLSEIATMLRDSGMGAGHCRGSEMPSTRDGTRAFVDRIRLKQAEIEKIGGADSYSFVLSMYSGLHSAIVQRRARRRDRSRPRYLTPSPFPLWEGGSMLKLTVLICGMNRNQAG